MPLVETGCKEGNTEEYIECECVQTSKKSAKNGSTVETVVEHTSDNKGTENKGERKAFERFIKILYTLAWIAMVFVILFCVNETGLFRFFEIVCYPQIGFKFENPVVCIAIVTYIISMIMNYYSYFMCIAFTVFIRNVANQCDDIDFNYGKPSNTLVFHQLVYASSRVAMAFFADSMLYVILTALDMRIGSSFGIIDTSNSVEIGIITVCVLFPCILSFILVFMLPKAFLSRLLRKWKRRAVEEVMDGRMSVPDEKYLWLDDKIQERLDRVYADRLPLVQVEVVTAVAAVVVDAASIILTLRV